MDKASKNESIMIERLEKYINTKGVSNSFLVQLIELSETYLNPLTIQEYADKYKMSYNGVKKFREVTKLLGHKFVIENE